MKATAPFYDQRPVGATARCPRCRKPVSVSRCRTAAREVCGSCGLSWTPGPQVEREGVR